MTKRLALLGAIIIGVTLARAVVWACPQLPIISTNKTSITLSAAQGSNPANQAFEVWNSGAGTLNFSISDNQTWLSVSPSSGSSSGAHVGITVSFNTTSLSAGNYNATITVSGNAQNSPRTISVTLTVVAPEYRSTPKMHGNWN